MNIDNLMEAYMIQRESPEPYHVYDIINDIEQTPLDITNTNYSYFSQSENIKNRMEIYVRQNIMCTARKILFQEVLRGISFPDEKRVFGLPAKWRNSLSKKGFKVDTLKSRLKWSKTLLSFFLKGLLKTFEITFSKQDYYVSPQYPYAVLMSVPNDTIPQNEETASYTFPYWVHDKNLLSRDVIKTFAVTQPYKPDVSFNDIKAVRSPFPKLQNKQKIVFFLVALQSCIHACFGFLFGRWWQIVSLDGVVEALYLQQFAKQEIAKNYVFNTSSFRVRPLWTYIAEEKGAVISLCYYSASAIRFYKGQKDRQAPTTAGFKIMTWPEYLAPDKHFKDFLIESCKIPAQKIKIVGPVDFSDNGDEIPDIPSNAVAVFDVSAYEPSHFAQNHMIVTYPTVEIVCQFLNDVYDVLSSLNKHMVLKTKRLNNKNIHGEYIACIEKLRQKDNVTIIENNISARRVIANVNVGVSIPFTSAAIFSGNECYKSIYYDPTNNFTDRVREAHGFPVLGKKDDLKKWLSET